MTVIALLPLLLCAAVASFDDAYRAGLEALAANRLAEARVQLEAAVSADAKQSRVWVALARTYWKLGESAKASAAADKASKLAAGDSGLLKLLALHYGEANQPMKACEMHAQYDAQLAASCFLRENAPQRALALGGRAKVEQAFFEYANELLRAQQFDKAAPVLEQGVKAFPQDPQLALALGVSYYGLRRFADAATAFERTIALAPEVEQPYLFLGKMIDQLAPRLPRIIVLAAAFERAHPESFAGYLLHAKALMASSSSANAEQLLKKAAELNPKLAEAHFQLGVLAERAAKLYEATNEFEQAAALDPRDAATHYHLARLYDRLDKPDFAQQERDLHKKLMNAAPDAAK